MGVFWSVITVILKILKMTSFFWASPIARPISDLIEGMAAASLSFGRTNHIHQPPERLAPEVRIAMCLWYTYDIHIIYTTLYYINTHVHSPQMVYPHFLFSVDHGLPVEFRPQRYVSILWQPPQHLKGVYTAPGEGVAGNKNSSAKGGLNLKP